MSNKFILEEPMTAEDLQNHYIGLLIDDAQRQGDRIEKDTLMMFSLVSMARSLEYIEFHLQSLCAHLEKPTCKKS